MDRNLENIKVGDKVYYETHSFGTRIMNVRAVTKVTAKQFVVEGGDRFTKEGGRKLGNVYCQCHIATEEEIENYNHILQVKKMTNKIRRFTTSSLLDSVPLTDLEAIYQIIKEYE